MERVDQLRRPVRYQRYQCGEINRGTSYKESKSGTLQAGGRLFARHTLNDAGRDVFGHFSVNYSNADGSGFSNGVMDFLSSKYVGDRSKRR